MTIKKILFYPNPALRKQNKDIETIDEKIKTLSNDMIETMYAAPGIGLAAPQIGVNLKVFVMDCTVKKESPRTFINPKIVQSSDESEKSEEGCLSFPDQFVEVIRPITCKISFMNLEGNEIVEDFEDLEARCIQHEIDHLNGKLFIDHLSRLKRNRIKKKLQKVLTDF